MRGEGWFWGERKVECIPSGEDDTHDTPDAPEFSVHDIRVGEDGVDGGGAVRAVSDAVVGGGKHSIAWLGWCPVWGERGDDGR